MGDYSVPLFGKSPRLGHGPEAYGNKCFTSIRLSTGNTLISTGNGQRLIEVRPQKKIVWQIAWPSSKVLSTPGHRRESCNPGASRRVD